MDGMWIASFLGLIGSLVLLWWAGSRSVKYAVAATRAFGMSSFFVGFVVMSVSTGFPELAIALTAAWRGVSSLSVGDILGSNLYDISVVLAIPIFFCGRLHLRGHRDRRELLISLIIASATMALVFLADILTPWHGLALLLIYVMHLVWLWTLEHPAPAVEVEEVPRSNLTDEKALLRERRVRNGRLIVLARLGASLGIVMLAAQAAVVSGVRFASVFSIRLGTIGTIFFAAGTSLPELILNFHACRRKEYALALGNSLGSVFQQGTFILGLLSLISTQPVSPQAFRMIAPFMFACFVVIGFGLLYRRRLGRREGAVLFALYIGFLLKTVLWC